LQWCNYLSPLVWHCPFIVLKDLDALNFDLLCVATLLWGSVRMKLTFPKLGLGSPLGLPKLQSSITGVKTRCIGVFFISLGKLSKFRCRKWPHMGHLDMCSTSYGKTKGRESNWQFDSQPLKVGNRLDPGACKWSEICCWKAFKEGYKFTLDLILIGGLSKELWPRKVSEVQTEIVSGLLLGSPGTKSHSDVGAA